ncbi:MAG: hypothetical protein JNM52_02450, partial [Betaproteobacteria bacterium]|nr:hypothetical protein [Betaproteobacteria bacterium]
VALSLLVHGLLLLVPHRQENLTNPASQGPLVVQLTPQKPQAVEPPAASEAPTPPAPRPALPRPPLMAKPSAKPTGAAIPPDPLPPETPPPKPVTPTAPPVDFMAMVEARRAQRRAAEGTPNREPTEDEVRTANINRNLRTLSQGRDNTGGVFQILHMGHRFAEFSFNGWSDQRINGWRQVIEVDAGIGGDVEIAIVRKMIEVIRQHYQGDFNWESRRLGRVVKMSARLEDTAGLEAFMMREFFN